MDNQTIINIIEIVITSVIVPFIAWGLKSLTSWIESKTENDKIKQYIDFAAQAVEIAVNETTQTYVESLKVQGAFDEEAQKIAFSMTFEKAKSLLSETAKDAITLIYGDLSVWLTSKIESVIAQDKQKGIIE